MLAEQLTIATHAPWFRGLLVALTHRDMAAAQGARQQHLHRLRQQLIAGVTEHLLGLTVDHGDAALAVHQHDGIGRRLNHQPEAFLGALARAQVDQVEQVIDPGRVGQHAQAQRDRHFLAEVAASLVLAGQLGAFLTNHQLTELFDRRQKAFDPFAHQALGAAIKQFGGAAVGHLDPPLGITQERSHRQTLNQQAETLFTLTQLVGGQLVGVQLALTQVQVTADQQRQQGRRHQAEPQAETAATTRLFHVIHRGAADFQQPVAAIEGQL